MKMIHIECDCCHTQVNVDDPLFTSFVKIHQDFDYSAGPLDGSRVESDLCIDCLKKLLGSALRVYPPAYPRDDGPLTSEQIDAIRESAASLLPKGRVVGSKDLCSIPTSDLPTVAQVLKYSVSIFQSEAGAFTWLSAHCPALGAHPIDLLNTQLGRENVLEVLVEIVHDVYQ
jgi:hypothetical protein